MRGDFFKHRGWRPLVALWLPGRIRGVTPAAAQVAPGSAYKNRGDSDELALAPQVCDDPPTDDQLRELHRTIDKVTRDIQSLSFNTAIARMMEFVNFCTPLERRPRAILEPFVTILSPFAPHLAEELWEILGRPAPVSLAPWPEADERWLRDETVEIPVQIQGKLRSRVVVPAGADAAALQAAAAADPRIAEQLAGRRIVKVVAVPGRLVNFVLGD
jgi:leucyl-tRNA synthetase